MNATKTGGAGDHDSIHLLEWIISGVGLLLVAASLGYLLYKATIVDPKPAVFAAKLLKTRATTSGESGVSGAYVATIELANRGGRTAAKVHVVVELAAEDGTTSRDVEIDYLPPRSTREVSVLFSQRPTESNLKIKFTSYCDP